MIYKVIQTLNFSPTSTSGPTDFVKVSFYNWSSDNYSIQQGNFGWQSKRSAFFDFCAKYVTLITSDETNLQNYQSYKNFFNHEANPTWTLSRFFIFSFCNRTFYIFLSSIFFFKLFVYWLVSFVTDPNVVFNKIWKEHSLSLSDENMKKN